MQHNISIPIFFFFSLPPHPAASLAGKTGVICFLKLLLLFLLFITFLSLTLEVQYSICGIFILSVHFALRLTILLDCVNINT